MYLKINVWFKMVDIWVYYVEIIFKPVHIIQTRYIINVNLQNIVQNIVTNNETKYNK